MTIKEAKPFKKKNYGYLVIGLIMTVFSLFLGLTFYSMGGPAWTYVVCLVSGAGFAVFGTIACLFDYVG